MYQDCELRVRWLWSIDRPPIENGGLVIADGQVMPIERPAADAIDLGDVCIVPAFVNAHTHLEFSDLVKPIPFEATFANWIANVIAHRRKQQEGQPSTVLHSVRRETILQGLEQSWKSGCGIVVDMITEPWSVESLTTSMQNPSSTPNWQSELEVFALAEVLGTEAARAQQTLDFARQVATGPCTQPGDIRVRYGISPHAPYSTPLKLVEEAVQLANQKNQLVSMHLAETREEIEFLDHGTGPIADMLRRFVSTPIRPGEFSVQEYLEVLSTAHRSLIVHGNYLTETNIDFIQRHNDCMAVIFCPRTHAFFGHENHSWKTLLARGIQVFLGTDSLASNPDLNILDEARFLYQRDRSIHPDVLLSMITTRPKRFLNETLPEPVGFANSNVLVPCDARKSAEVGVSILSGAQPATPLSLEIQRRMKRL
jgi:aminodeoxyfutalosine deaminase